MKTTAQRSAAKSGSKELIIAPKVDETMSPEGFIYLTGDPEFYNLARESIVQKMQMEYPAIPLEVIRGEAPEFDVSGYRRRLIMLYPIPMIPAPVPDPGDIILPADIEAEAEAMAEGVNPDDEDALEEIQAAQDAFREASRIEIWQERTAAREEMLSEIDLIKGQRATMLSNFVKKKPFESAKYLLVKKWPKSDAIRLKIEQHPEYRSSTSAEPASTIHQILSITARLFSDTEEDPALRIENAVDRLRHVKMLNAREYDTFMQRFNEARRLVTQEGGRVEQAVLISYFREGLFDIPFLDQKNHHRDRVFRGQFANTIEGFMTQMTNAYRDWEKLKVPIVEKEAAIVLNVSEPYDDDEQIEDDVKVHVEAKEKPKKSSFVRPERCKMCSKKHGGQCTNVEAVRRYFQEKLDKGVAEAESMTAKLKLEGKKKIKIGSVKVIRRGSEADCDSD